MISKYHQASRKYSNFLYYLKNFLITKILYLFLNQKEFHSVFFFQFLSCCPCNFLYVSLQFNSKYIPIAIGIYVFLIDYLIYSLFCFFTLLFLSNTLIFFLFMFQPPSHISPTPSPSLATTNLRSMSMSFSFFSLWILHKRGIIWYLSLSDLFNQIECPQDPSMQLQRARCYFLTN